jgi:pSer/pThr/pTyr-binding forkhead associated (FHA) protein
MPLRLRLLPSPAAASGSGGGRGPTEARSVELPDDTAEIRIGRRPDLELPLPYPALSALHARLFRSDAGWQIEDLGSTNGTRVDGQRLPARAPRAIGPGAQLTLGRVTLVFDGAVASGTGAERTATIAKRLVSDLFAASPDLTVPTLAVAGGVPAGAPLRLETPDRRYVAGRAETCDLRLASEEISREHLEIVRQWDGVVVKDLGSKNGVLVNGALLTGPRRVRDGDTVQVGPAILRLSDPADRYLRDFEALAGRSQDRAQDNSNGGEDQETSEPGTEPLEPPAAERAPGAAVALPSAARQPTAQVGGSRMAIIIAAVVLIVVGVVVAALVFGG